ncbi:hypothetical protein niasHT_029568 [Heterodera trifolii]|uniref:Homeobox domain-containing protein n=1 Tax=Heterodera trifolii TaxID=157864 RepID=A0ABD2JB75_9BILA
MDCSSKIPLPNELLSELSNAFLFDFRWSVLRLSSSVFDHFLAKRQQQILQNVDLKLQKIVKSYEQREGFSSVEKMSIVINKIIASVVRNVAEAVLGARALISLHTSNSDQLYLILEERSTWENGLKLMNMWYDAHYQQAEQMLGKSPLGPVDKYRVRKKHPLPWAKPEVNCFNNNTRKILMENYLTDAYPSPAVMKQLAQETYLTETQVGHWFVNRRQRDKSQQQKISADHPLQFVEEIKAQKRVVAEAKKLFEAATARLEQLEQQQQQAQNRSSAKMPSAESEEDYEFVELKEMDE